MRTTSKKHGPKVIFFAPPEKPIYNVVYFKIKLAHLLPPILVFFILGAPRFSYIMISLALFFYIMNSYLMRKCVKIRIEFFQISSTFLYGFEMIFKVNNKNSHIILVTFFQQHQSNILVLLVFYDEICSSICV